MAEAGVSRAASCPPALRPWSTPRGQHDGRQDLWRPHARARDAARHAAPANVAPDVPAAFGGYARGTGSCTRQAFDKLHIEASDAFGFVQKRLLAPDGWELRTSGFISGRPVYAPVRTTNGPGRLIRLQIGDDEAGKLDLVLGQAHRVLGENGDVLAQNLILGAILTVRRNGGFLPDALRQLERL